MLLMINHEPLFQPFITKRMLSADICRQCRATSKNIHIEKISINKFIGNALNFNDALSTDHYYELTSFKPLVFIVSVVARSK